MQRLDLLRPLVTRLRVTPCIFPLLLATAIGLGPLTLAHAQTEFDIHNLNAMAYTSDYGAILAHGARITVNRSSIDLGYVNNLLIRDGNQAWVSTDSGLFDIDLDTLQNAPIDELSSLAKSSQVTSLPTAEVAFANDGTLWIATGKYGLLSFHYGDGTRFDYNTTPRRWYGTTDGTLSNNILSVHASSDGTVWAGTPLGLVSFDRNKWQEVPELNGKWIYDIEEQPLPDGTLSLIARTDTGVFYSHDSEREEWFQFTGTDQEPTAAMIGVGDSVFVATDSNLIRFYTDDFSRPILSTYTGVDLAGIAAIAAPQLDETYIVLGYKNGDRAQFTKEEWTNIWD